MSTTHTSDVPSFDDACRLVISIGEAAHGYGSGAARLEAFLSRLTTAFGFSGVFRSTPTEMVFAFQEDDDHPQRVHLAALPGTGLDLAKLAQVGELVDAVAAKQVSVSQATARLDEIARTPHPWGVLAGAFSYAAVGAGLAVLFSLGWWDVLLPTLLLGAGMLVVLIVLKRISPSLPGALIVAAAGGAAVVFLNLEDQGVAVMGSVPSGLPTLHFSNFMTHINAALLRDAIGITLMSFTSGMLTVKSFAKKNHYDVDANQELIAFGASNIASGLGAGFAVTGTGSRTAVNDSVGGKSQMVGIIAAAVMLVVLLFFTAPLAFVPTAVLAAVILVAVSGLFDFAAIRELYDISLRELALCLGTSLGVLVFGMLPGILLAILLSLAWLLAVGSRPSEEVLGEVAGFKGFFSLAQHPDAREIPGLLVYRFNSSLVFFNADTFRDRLRGMIEAAAEPVQWVIVDASPFNVMDATAFGKVDELREELSGQGIVLNFAGPRGDLMRFFKTSWLEKRNEDVESFNYPTINAAVTVFQSRQMTGQALSGGGERGYES